MINPGQIKAARAMLGLSQRQLARKAGVSIATLNNIERGAQTDPKVRTMEAIQQALESNGIQFNNTREGMGVLLRPIKDTTVSATILIVDDSVEDRTLYKQWLKKTSDKKFTVIEAEDARTGYNAFVESQPDCLILDFKMYGMDGFQLLAELKQNHLPLPPIIFVTGLHNGTLKENAERQGVCAYLDKKTMNKETFYDSIKRAFA